MKDTTVIVTTFERPKVVRRFLKSVREFYPDIDIIVSDNGKCRPALEDDAMNKYGCRYLKLPFDSGVSNARNKALDMAETKYAVICDDDYEFTEQTKLENFRKVLESDEKVGIVAGELIYWGEQRQYMHKIKVNEEEKFFLILRIFEPEWIYTDGVKYCYAEHVFQFFMMRNVPEIRWDADLKCQWEHVELALRLKREGKWRTVSTPDVVAKHVSGRMSRLYVRHRIRTDDWERFHKKTGFIGNIGGVEQPPVDSKGRRVISFPEHMYHLLKARNMGVADEANPKRPINNQIGG